VIKVLTGNRAPPSSQPIRRIATAARRGDITIINRLSQCASTPLKNALEIDHGSDFRRETGVLRARADLSRSCIGSQKLTF